MEGSGGGCLGGLCIAGTICCSGSCRVRGCGPWIFECPRTQHTDRLFQPGIDDRCLCAVMVDKSVVLPNDTEIQATINKIPDIAAVDGNYRTAVAVCYYWELLSSVTGIPLVRVAEGAAWGVCVSPGLSAVPGAVVLVYRNRKCDFQPFI